VVGKLLFELLDFDTTDVVNSILLSGLDHLFLEVHLFEVDLIVWGPNILSLNSVDSSVSFTIFPGLANTELIPFLSFEVPFGNFLLIDVGLDIDSLLDSILLPELDPLDFLLFFC